MSSLLPTRRAPIVRQTLLPPFHEDRQRRTTAPYRLPFLGTLWLPSPSLLHKHWLRGTSRRARQCLAIVLAVIAGVLLVLILRNTLGQHGSTLVFSPDERRRVWRWEIASGHYGLHRPVPVAQLQFPSEPMNPGIPSDPAHGAGPDRIYPGLDLEAYNFSFPTRPLHGSIADLDAIMARCDFTLDKYVRDCLEFLRIGGGLVSQNRLRRGNLDAWKYIYIEKIDPVGPPSTPDLMPTIIPGFEPPLKLGPIVHPRPTLSLATTCDPRYPRIFHVYWKGSFTDKLYNVILSFLYTQNWAAVQPDACPPQLWLWINPDADEPTQRGLLTELRLNRWSEPFLAPRFRTAIHFKLWDTAEQLDAIPELRDDWRSFHSGGKMFKTNGKVLKPKKTKSSTKSTKEGDKFSIIMSDMARFVLCHRFGGIYLDADTVFLRDWEPLWGQKTAFAYRWSRLPLFNTAVLKLNKGSALGSFIIRTALRNGLDFHPMMMSRYINDAHLTNLLLMLPDALFDSSWLNNELENYQLDRPPFPFLPRFSDFFSTPVKDSAPPNVVGADAFFRGAFSYHWHNRWTEPFDSSRDRPDLDDQLDEMGGEDTQDLSWSAVLKRTYEAYVRGERPSMYGEMIRV